MDIRKTFVILILVLASTGQDVGVHPKNASVFEGDDHHLQCQFRQIVHKCSWLQSNSPISINDRYRYLDSTAKGINTTNCTIVISEFKSHDAHEWQCSYTITASQKGDDMAKSHKAFLTLMKKEEHPTTTGSMPGEPTVETVDQGDNFLGLGMPKTYAIIVFAAGVSFLVVVIIISIMCCRRKKGQTVKPIPESDQEEVTYNNLSSSLPAHSHSNLLKCSITNGSSLSICTNCRQMVAGPSTPSSQRSTPKCKHNEGRLPWRLHNDVTGSCDSTNTKQLRLGSESSLPSIPESLDSYEGTSDLLDRSPSDQSSLVKSPPLSAMSFTTANPLYESACVDPNNGTRVFFPASSSTTSAVVPETSNPSSAIKTDNKRNIQLDSLVQVKNKNAPEPATGSHPTEKDENEMKAGKSSPKNKKNEKLKKQNELEAPDYKELYENLKYRGSHIL